MTKPTDKPVEMNLDKESPLVPIDQTDGTKSATGNDADSGSWIITDLVAPFFIANVLFWPCLIALGWFVGNNKTNDQLGALLFGALAGFVAIAIVGGIYGWLIGARYMSPERLAKHPDVQLAMKWAKGSRRTLVVLQFLYFPACVFGGCTGFFTIGGLFG